MILNNLLFAMYDEPAYFPFLSNSKPYYLEKLGTFNFFSKEKFKFSIECAGGSHGLFGADFASILPFPSISCYFKFTHKNFGLSISIFDRYQYTERYKNGWLINLKYDLNFIYTSKIGFSYNPVSKFVFNISGDINYGLRKYKCKGRIIDTSFTYQDYSLSYSF